MSEQDRQHSAESPKLQSPEGKNRFASLRKLLPVAVPVLGLTTSALIANAATSTLWNFESGNFSGWYKELCCSHSAVVSTSSPVRDGRYSVKFTLKKTDPDIATSKRAELRHGYVPANSAYTYRFSNFLPTSFTKDPSMEIVAQWHNVPDYSIGEKHPSPPLYLRTMNGRLYLGRRWDPNRLTVNNTPGKGGGTEMLDLGPYQVGTWTDWKFYVKWSYKSDGVVQIWKNGSLIKSIYGPNTYNDAKGPYFKVGIYKPDWKYNPSRSTTTQRVIYYDAVRMDSGRT